MKKAASRTSTPVTPVPAPSPSPAEVALPEDDLRGAINRLKRERIVATAVQLFHERGYGRTTLEQVADAMNVTKPFIYAHFKSKNELLLEICSRSIRLAHESLNRAAHQEGTATQRLEAVIGEFLMAVLNHQHHAVIYSREEKELAPEDRELINSLRRAFDRRLVALIEEGVASGEFQVDDVPLAALAIGGIVGWSPGWYRRNGRLPMPQVVQGLVSLVLAMLKARPARRRSRAVNPTA